jgi:hypothetical protein
MTDFRALCEELADELESWISGGYEADIDNAHALIDRARAALAEQPVGPRMVYHYSPVTIAECGGPCEQGPQYCDCGEIRGEPAPEPVRPTDEELNALWIEQYGYTGNARVMSILEFKDAARAVLARWGQS